ncbi:SpoIIE family protein phosphatase [Pseudonocardia sp. H11422]|uniref:SpoIIE family protein phosphatase n=1 Tax=Pseudonocardia sp. H11422 TaxID=2835866 RepID=UPI001BDCCC23|nr:SpoIIE family protein phosphatase [Pseudonocardia sp. H11422]
MDVDSSAAVRSAAFDDIPGAVWQFTGPDHVVVAANREARVALGARADILGRPIADVLPELATGSIVDQLTDVRTHGEQLCGARWQLPARPHGELVEVHYSVDLVRLSHPDGTGVLAHARPVTSATRMGPATGPVPAGSRDTMLALARALLPEALPVLPDVMLAAHYVPANSEPHAGGDWFDVVTLRSGLIALVVGDVVGHGTGALAAMSELRALIRESLLSGVSVAGALGRVDRYAATTARTRTATLAVVLLDPASGELTYTGCGHPPPLICSDDGTARTAAAAGGAPLGTGSVPMIGRGRLDPGELLVLYTDGLIERPGHTVSDGLAQLAIACGRAWRPGAAPGPATARILDRMTGTGSHDDVVVLATTRLPKPVAPVEFDVPAQPRELAGVRGRITRWLEDLGVTADSLGTVPLIVSELVSNCIEHAYPVGEPGRVRVTARLDGRGGVRVTIADDGSWRPGAGTPGRRAPHGGFGLAVARDLADRLEIETRQRGTTVTATCALQRPTSFGLRSGRRHLTALRGPGLTVTDTGADPPVLAIAGPVDVTTVGELRSAILHATAGCTRPGVVDLAGVTLLTSAGVRLLYELTESSQVTPRVIAPAGCAARSVLELTRLEHLLRDTS